MSNLHVFKKRSPLDVRAELAAEFAKFKLEKVVELDFAKKEHKTEEHLKISPFGSCPVLELKEGSIFETKVIARYVAVNGTNKHFYAKPWKIDVVCSMVDSINHSCSEALHSLFAGKKINKGVMKLVNSTFDKYLPYFEKILTKNTYIMGSHITLADTTLFSTLSLFFQSVFDDKVREKYVSLTRWFHGIAAQKETKKVCGVVKVKESAKAKKKSKFDLEAWKRFYMNNEVAKSTEYFWKNIDISCNSIWFATYKYGDELAEVYKTGNLMGGVSQRTQPFAKSTFGILCIVGTEEKHTIKCMWVYEEKTVPKYVIDGIDHEVYDFKRADWKKDKKQIESFLDYDSGKLGEETIIEGRVFR